MAQQGSLPFKGRAAFFSAQQLLHTGSPTSIILAAWLLYTEKAVSKHKSCNNFMNILPTADITENIFQNSRVKQKPWSQDHHIVWHILVLPSIPFLVLGGRAKASYLLLKVSKQEEIPNRETCQPSAPCQQAGGSVQHLHSTDSRAQDMWGWCARCHCQWSKSDITRGTLKGLKKHQNKRPLFSGVKWLKIVIKIIYKVPLSELISCL